LSEQAHIRVGQSVPQVAGEALFPDGEMKPCSLTDYQGKWLVLFFYPLDFTFVCPTEIQGFSQQLGQFHEANTEVLSVSTDSAFTHKAWVEHGLGPVKFPMLADTNHEISRSFGVLIPEKGIALRGTFIIDPEGILRSMTVNDLPVGRSIEETLRTLQALQTGGLTACGWNPGDKTL
jgi:peroxiredoxin 2/4